MFYVKFILLIVCTCCLINLIRTDSSESDYDQEEEDDEFAKMKNDKDFKKGDKMMARSKEAEDDEFANMNEEFENDKDFLNMNDNGKPKEKEDIEFQIAFGDDESSKEKGEKDEFYDTVKDDLDGDFNMYSSNKMDKRIKCENSEDCEDQNNKTQRPDLDNNQQNRTIKEGLVDNDKTTIVYLNYPTTNRPNSQLTSQNYPQRQFEEETKLKVDHHQEDDHWNLSPLECDCDAKVQAKIIGGTNAAKSKYPYAVAIFTLVGRGSFCGATIVK